MLVIEIALGIVLAVLVLIYWRVLAGILALLVIVALIQHQNYLARQATLANTPPTYGALHDIHDNPVHHPRGQIYAIDGKWHEYLSLSDTEYWMGGGFNDWDCRPAESAMDTPSESFDGVQWCKWPDFKYEADNRWHAYSRDAAGNWQPDKVQNADGSLSDSAAPPTSQGLRP